MRVTRVIAAAGLVLLMVIQNSALAVEAFAKDRGLPGGAPSNITFAQASIDAKVDECRRMALQEQGVSIALYDSSATKDKQQFDVWSEKTRILIEASKKSPIVAGRFGDPAIFEGIRRSPAQVATEVSADVEAALRAVTQILTVIENQRQATPNDPVLYCDYVFVWAHRNVLQRLSRYATIHKLLLDAIERYFSLRIKIYSSISRTEYERERIEISDALLDLYDQERQSSAGTQIMLKQLLKQ